MFGPSLQKRPMLVARADQPKAAPEESLTTIRIAVIQCAESKSDIIRA